MTSMASKTGEGSTMDDQSSFNMKTLSTQGRNSAHTQYRVKNHEWERKPIKKINLADYGLQHVEFKSKRSTTQ